MWSVDATQKTLSVLAARSLAGRGGTGWLDQPTVLSV
jgi:hypothetical protein